MRKKILRNKNNCSNLRLFSFISHQTFTKLNNILLVVFLFLLPTQLGKHFFFTFSYISGVRTDYLSPTIYLTDVVAILLFILNIKPIFDLLIKKEALITIVLFAINIFFSQSVIISLLKTIKIFEFILVFFVIYKSKLKINWVVTCLFSSAIIQFFLSLEQIIKGQSLQGFWYFLGERQFNLSTPGIAKAFLNNREFLRPYGTFSHPNSMAGFYLIIYLFILTTKKILIDKVLLRYLFLFVITCLIFLTFSKAAIITYIFLTIIYFLVIIKKPCRLCIISKILSILITGTIFLIAGTDPLSIGKRIELIKNSLTIIGQHPFFGTGIGAYLVFQQSFNSHYWLFFNQPVHNVFLLLTTELGIPMVIALFIIIFNLLKKVGFFSSFANILILLAFLLTGFVDHYWITLQQNILVLAVVFGLMFKKMEKKL